MLETVPTADFRLDYAQSLGKGSPLKCAKNTCKGSARTVYKRYEALVRSQFSNPIPRRPSSTEVCTVYTAGG